MRQSGGVTKWLILAIAVVSEVCATLALRATLDDAWWAVVVVAGYIVSFGLVGLLLRKGMPIGVAYGVWGASGVALTAVLGVVIFGEALSPVAIIGIGAIIIGVVLVETGARPEQPGPTQPGPTQAGEDPR